MSQLISSISKPLRILMLCYFILKISSSRTNDSMLHFNKRKIVKMSTSSDHLHQSSFYILCSLTHQIRYMLFITKISLISLHIEHRPCILTLPIANFSIRILEMDARALNRSRAPTLERAKARAKCNNRRTSKTKKYWDAVRRNYIIN